MSKLYFKESQKFNQWWVWLILLGTLGLFVFMDIKQIAYHQLVGNHPMSNTALIVASIVVMLMMLLFAGFRLDTEINSDGIAFRFLPFMLRYKMIRWIEMEKAYVRKYNPLLEYGGWGIRYSITRSGRAYNVKGNMGLQLELRNRRKILIGTQKPDEMESALKTFYKESGLVMTDNKTT
jgi:hypothetical protein